MINYIIPVNDEFTIPRPPNSTNYAFNRNGNCLGMVIGAYDQRNREIPEWLIMSAAYLLIWNGMYMLTEEQKNLEFEWHLN